MKSMLKTTLFGVLMLMCAGVAKASSWDDLHKQLCSLTDTFPAQVGIAVTSHSGDTLLINGNDRFPMLSVMKLPQAMAVADALCRSHTSLLRTIDVAPSELAPNTWSPLRDKHPDGGKFSIAKLLEYSLQQSDNNACDILFNHIADVPSVNSFVAALGIADCQIVHNEAQMNDDLSRCYDNYITPLAAIELLKKLYEQRNADRYRRFVWRTMTDCRTGTNRIPCLISDRVAAVTHKTGTGPLTADGKIMAVNDIGCISLPNNRYCHLAVFIRDARCSMAQCEALIARVALLCVDALSQ
ncbi:MAG: class A beta-lactamase [Muribaculaceae bacterium]